MICWGILLVLLWMPWLHRDRPLDYIKDLGWSLLSLVVIATVWDLLVVGAGKLVNRGVDPRLCAGGVVALCLGLGSLLSQKRGHNAQA